MSDEKTYLWKRDQNINAIDGLHNDPSPTPMNNAKQHERGKVMTSGLHHVALVCKDMKETVQFYEQAMGFKLRSIFPMHGISGAKHCFLEIGNGAEISFVEYGEDHPNHGQRNGPGEQHHFAFKCDSMEQFKALREQIKNTGTKISRPVDHEICYSCYFDDPNGFQLEITCSKENGQYNETYYQLDLLDRKPFPEEDLFHPKHKEFMMEKENRQSKL